MDLHVKFDGHEIIVTRPGTDFILAYRKRPDSPNLVLTRSWEKPTRDRSVAPDNLIDPKRLTPLTRTSLREAFRAVAKVQPASAPSRDSPGAEAAGQRPGDLSF